MIDLSDRTAIVTGGARGIGRAIVLKLAAQGADIAFMDRGAVDVAEQTRADVEALGRRAHFFPGDVTNPDDCSAFVQAAIDAHGRVDILVNNAGITRDDLIMRMGIDEWKMVLEVIAICFIIWGNQKEWDWVQLTGNWLLYLVALVAVVSMGEYFYKFSRQKDLFSGDGTAP